MPVCLLFKYKNCIQATIWMRMYYKHGLSSETEPDLIQSQIRFFFFVARRVRTMPGNGVIPAFAVERIVPVAMVDGLF